MRKLFAFTVLLAVAPAFGQDNNRPFQGMIDGMIMGERIKMERQRVANEAELARSQAQLLNAQAESIRLETERLKRQNQATPPEPLAPSSDSAFTKAARAVELRYPDFQEYKDEAARLIPEFDTSRGLANVNLEHYIEALYLIAKHASFSQKANPPSSETLAGSPGMMTLQPPQPKTLQPKPAK